MKSNRNSRWFFVLILIAALLTGCARQTPIAPTLNEAAETATPTAAALVGIETPITVDGVEFVIVLATTDEKAYDTGPVSIQTAPGFALMHIEAVVVSGQPDFNALNEGVSLVDGEGKACQPASMGIEKPMWEFSVPDGQKNFTLKFGDGQAVVLDSIFNKPALPPAVTTAEPTPVPSATAIPPTLEPAALIRLGPGKFGKAISLEVLDGRYQLSSGDTLLAGSAVAVNADWLTFPPNLAIDIEGASITLKGVVYPSGSKLITDSSGNLVPRSGGEPAGLAKPPADSSPGYVIPAGAFSLDTREDCNTNVTIKGVTDKGFKVGGTLSMHNDQFVLWCPRARHTWEGTLTYEGYTFQSDAADPLIFSVDSQGGYEYIGGSGKVTQPDGEEISLGLGGGSPAKPTTRPTVKPTARPTIKPTAAPTAIPVVGKMDIFPTVFLSEPFDNNASQWPVGDVEGQWWSGTRLIKNGVLDWDGTSNSNMNSTILPENPTLQNACSSQEINVRVRSLNSTMGGSFGLRLQSPDGNRSYAFLLDQNGYFAFFLIIEDSWTPLIDWKISPFVKAGAWNELSIQAEGTHFKLFINDKLAGEVDNSLIPSRQAGLIITANEAGERIQIQFDDFEIRLPATEQAAGCPLEISSEKDQRFTEVLLSDSFNNNSSGWSLGDVQTDYWKANRSIDKGVLTIKGESLMEMYAYAYTENDNPWDKEVGDQRASVKTRLINPPLNGAYGLILRIKENLHSTDFYVFLIDSDGYCAFFKTVKNEWTPLIDWKQVESLSPDGWNALAVEAMGDHFRLFINDTLVGEADDDTLAEGRTGLFVETYESRVKLEIEFDDFEILLPEN